MKRSDFYIKLTTAVLFFAVVCYIGVYIFESLKNPYETISAVSYTVEETRQAAGYVVREETVLAGSAKSALPLVGEGEKAAVGQTVAVEYYSASALTQSSEIRALELKIEQLEESAARGGDGASQATGCVLELSRAVQRGDLSDLTALSLRAEAYIFSGGGGADELHALREQLSRLEANRTDARKITAPVSGVFSSSTDGYESVTPDMLNGMTPSKLESLFTGVADTDGYAGKLITGIRWYYAAVMDAADASRLAPNNTVTVQFLGAYRASVDMKVEKIGRSEDGQCVVLLSSGHGIAEIASLRYVETEIVFNTFSGVRVPKEAIHLGDDGKTYVYLQTGTRSERVETEILAELGDAYIARDVAEANPNNRPASELKIRLRSGATIIVKANGLDSD